MTTFREILIATETELLSADLFFGHGYESAHDEAVALVLAAADCSLVDTSAAILDTGYPVTALPKLRAFLTARCEERLPVAYITGEAWLGHLCFKSDARALVPRSPVAELVLNHFEPWYQGPDPQVIIDVCCGGGSLGMLAKSLFPGAQVLLSDLDSAALSLASENTPWTAWCEVICSRGADPHASISSLLTRRMLTQMICVDCLQSTDMNLGWRWQAVKMASIW